MYYKYTSLVDNYDNVTILLLFLTFCSPSYHQQHLHLHGVRGIDCEGQSLGYTLFKLAILPFGLIIIFEGCKSLAILPSNVTANSSLVDHFGILCYVLLKTSCKMCAMLHKQKK